MSNGIFRTALVLGATGGIGGETAAALLRHGWRVVGMARDGGKARSANAGIDWVAGDAMQHTPLDEAVKRTLAALEIS